MFCPNCGTKNDDSALKCSQCGFDMKPRAAVSKHKGTVMFTASPAAAGAGAKLAPNLKGTMVGVAPPDASSGTSAAPVAPKVSNPALKGTMVGVAPPGIEDLKKQAVASKAAASPQGVNASQGPSSKLKGTMIGLAPPDMGAEVEAAKAKLAAKKAESAQARAAEAAKSAGVSAPSAPVTPAAAAASQAPVGAPSKSPASQLKGTMIGVAPPNMQAQINAARDLAAAKKAQADANASEAAAASRAVGEAQAAAPVEQESTVEREPPSEPDPLGGTMVGISPFASGAFTTEGASTHAQGTPAPTDFDDNTPAAEPEAGGLSDPVVSDAGVSDAGVSDAVVSAGAQPAPLRTNTFEQPRIPVAKSSAGPVALIVVLVAIVIGGIMFLMSKKSDEPAQEGPATEEAAPDAKAAE